MFTDGEAWFGLQAQTRRKSRWLGHVKSHMSKSRWGEGRFPGCGGVRVWRLVSAVCFKCKGGLLSRLKVIHWLKMVLTCSWRIYTNCWVLTKETVFALSLPTHKFTQTLKLFSRVLNGYSFDTLWWVIIINSQAFQVLEEYHPLSWWKSIVLVIFFILK